MILILVLGEGLRLVAVGVIAGLMAAIGLSRVLTTSLFRSGAYRSGDVDRRRTVVCLCRADGLLGACAARGHGKPDGSTSV